MNDNIANNLVLQGLDRRECRGFKGPRAAEWLSFQGFVLPTRPNSWVISGNDVDEVTVAQLGGSEFFIEGAVGTEILKRVASNTVKRAGVYPILRQDFGFSISGKDVHEVLTQVCSVNFGALALATSPVIMTLMMGVAVLILPQEMREGRRYRIWCDPTYSQYILDELGQIVVEHGGLNRGDAV